MRQTRTAQASIFELYAEHEIGERLSTLSTILDKNPDLLLPLEADLIDKSLSDTGRCGLTVESIFRCLLLKQQLQVSYDQLSFLLCDSVSYRTFTRLKVGQYPRKSSLQQTIRSIRPETLENVHRLLMQRWLADTDVTCEKLRIDSTVVKSNIAPPSDSQLLEDCIRVLSRQLSKSREITGVKIRFTDKRIPAKKLAFRIFNAKKAEKEALYPELLRMARLVIKQVDSALTKVALNGSDSEKSRDWVDRIKHYKNLTLKVISQTERRVIEGLSVPVSEKIVSIFEEHTDIIVKGARDVQYGHKVNLSTVSNGFITHLSIEDGNPCDKLLLLPVLHAHQEHYNVLPKSVVGDGCYASQENVRKSRELGVKRVVFSKPVGLSYHDMGVKKKTFDALKKFRAGIEGNISELKRAFGASKATWKNQDGFKAFVWSSVLSYNLTHMARQQLE